jgi:hypothetical protein
MDKAVLRALVVRWEKKVPCKRCTSVAQQDFPGEVSVNYPGMQRLNLSPVYICQDVLICLDCGFTELVIPGAELERLRVGMAQPRSQTA